MMVGRHFPPHPKMSATMPLFIDRHPFRVRPRHQGIVRLPADADKHLSVTLAVLVTEQGLEFPPPDSALQWWILDTGKEGEATCRRCDLEAAGLNPDKCQGEPKTMISAFGDRRTRPTRDADLWLLSNIPVMQNKPFRLELNGGIAFDDVSTPRAPDEMLPLIGMQAFRRARLQVLIDYAKGKVSIWTPGSLLASLALTARRALSGFSTVPMQWPIPN
jgi:hypothetical protein